MKKISILMVCIAAFVFVGCSSTSGASSSSAARKSGATCGTALVSLYNSYRATGTIDMNNGVNLANMLAVVAGYKQLKSNKSDANYRSDFAKGMASVGSGLITSANVGAIVDKLCNTAGLNDVNASTISQKAEEAKSIITILQMLKQ